LAKTIPQFVRELDKKREALDRLKIRAMNTTMKDLRQRLIARHFSGPTTPTSIRRQSGALIRSIIIGRALIDTSGVSALLSFTNPHASIHIGKRGRGTRISPVRADHLAIPTSFARNAQQVPLGGPFSSKWMKTFVAGKTIFGRRRGDPTVRPLFTLRDSVIVPQRIDIQLDILNPAQEIYTQHLEAGLEKVLA